MSREKTPEEWQEDGLKCEYSGLVMTAALCKDKITEMGGMLSAALNKMRV
jgi:hypothetical protein